MIKIINADVFEALASLPDESVHCIVTSPPYWGLRDYGHDGQIGCEPTMQEHIAVMVRVFRELRRVLRSDGTCWLNYGDCYARAPAKGGSGPNGKNIAYSDSYTHAQSAMSGSSDGKVGRGDRPAARNGALKEKDLCMIPARLAIALQDDGWWVRSEIIWAKPNPMPESVTDRPTSAHEKVFLLTKSARYWYDAEAVRVAHSPDVARAVAKWKDDPRLPAARAAGNIGSAPDRNDSGKALRICNSAFANPDGANLRNVWTIATKPYSEAHFATFPPDLPETCIKAGCPEGGTVLDPFGGAGTTGLVADRLQREAILIEINPEYADMAKARIERDAPMFAEVAT